MQIRIPTPNHSSLKIKVNLVHAEVPLLLGLDVLDNEKLLANNVQNGPQEPHHGWPMTYTCKHGQSILYAKSETIKLDRHFKHPTPGKL